MKMKTKLPQKKNHKSMSVEELKQKVETKLYGKQKPEEKLSDIIKNKLKNFDKFSIN